MRDDPTSFLISLPPGHSLHDIEVVLHLVEAAVVRKPSKQRANRVFGRHQDHRLQKIPPEYELAGRNSTPFDAAVERVGISKKTGSVL
jgi:hypothetical protein